MAKEKEIRLEYHLKFNGRNPRHMKSALVLATVEKKYKSSFIALVIEHYMKTNPFGISVEDLLGIYRQSDRSYQPKAAISENLKNAFVPPIFTSSIEDTHDKNGTGSAIDKAMDFYNIL